MIAQDTAELKFFEEFGDGSMYEGRIDLGNTQPGDGRRYKGRGAVMLVGRANYQRFGDALDLDLISHPESLSSSPEIALLLALPTGMKGSLVKPPTLETLPESPDC